MTARAAPLPLKAVLLVVLGLNAALWAASSRTYAKWDGVPPPPSLAGAVTMSLGDAQFSYRYMAIELQNLGDVGRDVTPLKNYDYDALGGWFRLLYLLDPSSDHVPNIAAYYFGATRVPHDAGVIARYLGAIGNVPAGRKWRWLAQAAYLAHHVVHDDELAMTYANQLVALNKAGVDMPQWARQMPAFLLRSQGDYSAARRVMEEMLVTDKTALPEEVNLMKSFLTEQLGVSAAEVESLMRRREAE